MFTALHIDANGNETLWNCTHARKFAANGELAGTHRQTAACGTQGEGRVMGPGVMLDLAQPAGVGEESSPTVFFPIFVPKSTDPYKPSGARVIIMNAAGKTVANWDLG